MVISFYGHSNFSSNIEYKEKLLALLIDLIGNQPATMYLGGWGDFDELAYSCCKKIKQINPDISLILVTPYITEHYLKNHLEPQRDKYDGFIYPELEKVPLKLAIVYRNRRMIEKSDIVICGIKRSFGGAYKSYLYAKKLNKKIINITDAVLN